MPRSRHYRFAVPCSWKKFPVEHLCLRAGNGCRTIFLPWRNWTVSQLHLSYNDSVPRPLHKHLHTNASVMLSFVPTGFPCWADLLPRYNLCDSHDFCLRHSRLFPFQKAARCRQLHRSRSGVCKEPTDGVLCYL